MLNANGASSASGASSNNAGGSGSITYTGLKSLGSNGSSYSNSSHHHNHHSNHHNNHSHSSYGSNHGHGSHSSSHHHNNTSNHGSNNVSSTTTANTLALPVAPTTPATSTTPSTPVASTSTALVLPSKALMLTNGAGLYKVFSTESVLNLLHCLYCKKPYRDPRLLHCGHTYCLPCLVQMNRYSTIRCIKCNFLQTVTSHAVDTLPKNLFVADIQCIPTVEIDRGATYKETLKSLEDLKTKLLDFSEKVDQSEDKLINLTDLKKLEVSEQVCKVIDHIKQLEEEFHHEIDEFKNNRLAVLRSAPPEFRETNGNLLQFVNQSLDDLMRPDIKEEDVKEIHNRCEEHRRLWNETEIIFNSNYGIGEIIFQPNESQPAKDLVGTCIQKFPQKLSSQRTSKGPISISECCPDGEYIVIENNSKRHDVNMTNWTLTHCVGSVRKISFKFPENFVLRSRQSVKLWASNRNAGGGTSSKYTSNSASSSTSSGLGASTTTTTTTKSVPSSQNSSSSSISSKSNYNLYNGGGGSSSSSQKVELGGSNQASSSSSGTATPSSSVSSTNDMNDTIENELIIYDIENWTCGGSQEIFIRLENEFGEEKASFKKTN